MLKKIPIFRVHWYQQQRSCRSSLGAKAKAEAADFSVNSHSHRGAEQR